MYIIITEFGEILQAETITEQDQMACEDGIISIVNADEMTTLIDQEWHPLENWNS